MGAGRAGGGRRAVAVSPWRMTRLPRCAGGAAGSAAPGGVAAGERGGAVGARAQPRDVLGRPLAGGRGVPLVPIGQPLLGGRGIMPGAHAGRTPTPGTAWRSVRAARAVWAAAAQPCAAASHASSPTQLSCAQCANELSVQTRKRACRRAQGGACGR